MRKMTFHLTVDSVLISAQHFLNSYVYEIRRYDFLSQLHYTLKPLRYIKCMLLQHFLTKSCLYISISCAKSFNPICCSISSARFLRITIPGQPRRTLLWSSNRSFLRCGRHGMENKEWKSPCRHHSQTFCRFCYSIRSKIYIILKFRWGRRWGTRWGTTS